MAVRRLAELGYSPLLALGEQRIMAPKATCLRQGEVASRFCLVSFGCFKAELTTSSGRSLIVGLHGAGDVFGLGEALAQRACRASAIAASESGCLLIPAARLLKLLAEEPELMTTLLPRLARHLVGCSNCLAEAACLRVETRLARLFLRLSANGRPDAQDGIWIPLHLCREELAELTATTVESCSRVMSDWRRQGIVFTSDGGFLVLDRPTLMQLAAA